MRQALGPLRDDAVLAVNLSLSSLTGEPFCWEVGCEAAGLDQNAAAALNGISDFLINCFQRLAGGKNTDDTVHDSGCSPALRR